MAAYGSPRFPQFGLSTPVQYEVEQGNGRRRNLNAYLLTVSIGHLVFQVFGHHIEQVIDLVPRDWKRDYSAVIWPDPGWARWPPAKHLDDKKLFDFSGTKFPTHESMRKAHWKGQRNAGSP
jgi:hypothetical protein